MICTSGIKQWHLQVHGVQGVMRWTWCMLYKCGQQDVDGTGAT